MAETTNDPLPQLFLTKFISHLEVHMVSERNSAAELLAISH